MAWELGRETKPTGNLSYLVVSCGVVLKDIRNVNTCALLPSESKDKQGTIGCHHLQVTILQLIIPVDWAFSGLNISKPSLSPPPSLPSASGFRSGSRPPGSAAKVA